MNQERYGFRFETPFQPVIGQPVLELELSTSWGGTTVRANHADVTRDTPTQLTVSTGRRYRKDSCRRLGCGPYDVVVYLVVPDDNHNQAVLTQYHDNQKRRRLVQKARTYLDKIHRLDREDVENANAIIAAGELIQARLKAEGIES